METGYVGMMHATQDNERGSGIGYGRMQENSDRRLFDFRNILEAKKVGGDGGLNPEPWVQSAEGQRGIGGQGGLSPEPWIQSVEERFFPGQSELSQAYSSPRSSSVLAEASMLTRIQAFWSQG